MSRDCVCVGSRGTTTTTSFSVRCARVTSTMEAIQKGQQYDESHDVPSTSALFVAGLDDLDSRRDLPSHNFFQIYFTIDILFT